MEDEIENSGPMEAMLLAGRWNIKWKLAFFAVGLVRLMKHEGEQENGRCNGSRGS